MKNVKFLTRLDEHRLRAGKSGVNSILTYDFVIEYEHNGLKWQYAVPAGFEHDGASIPLGLRNIMERKGPWYEAAIVHDCLYRHHSLSQKDSDNLFLACMTASKVSAWRRRGAWFALKVALLPTPYPMH